MMIGAQPWVLLPPLLVGRAASSSALTLFFLARPWNALGVGFAVDLLGRLPRLQVFFYRLVNEERVPFYLEAGVNDARAPMDA